MDNSAHDNGKVLYNYERHFVNPAIIIINKSHVVDKTCARHLKSEGINWQNKILFNGEEFPITPGLMMGGMTYGFKVILKDKDTILHEKEYPTELNIVGIEGIADELERLQEVKVYENGKYNTWRFDCNLKLICESSFVANHGRDTIFMKNNFVDENLTPEQKYNGAYTKKAE